MVRMSRSPYRPRLDGLMDRANAANQTVPAALAQYRQARAAAQLAAARRKEAQA